MPRWRLTEKHHLYTDPPTEWEQVEIDLSTGEQTRNRYVVPKFLDPEDPKLKNPDGHVVVCQGKKGHPKDIVFLGLPTPSMLPMDEEAQVITDSITKTPHPIEGLESIIDDAPPVLKSMQAQINALMMVNDELQRRMAALSTTDLNADIAANAAQQPKPAKERRI